MSNFRNPANTSYIKPKNHTNDNILHVLPGKIACKNMLITQDAFISK